MAKSDQQKAKEKLDKAFSLYIRLRDSDCNGYGSCYTCGKVKHYKEMHCGHWIPRNILSTRFDEMNAKIQCVGCNLYGNGKFVDFRINLVKDYGEDVVRVLEQKKFQVFKVDKNWYYEKIAYYTQEVEKLKNKTAQTS